MRTVAKTVARTAVNGAMKVVVLALTGMKYGVMTAEARAVSQAVNVVQAVNVGLVAVQAASQVLFVSLGAANRRMSQARPTKKQKLRPRPTWHSRKRPCCTS
jgi:hypothetical protein